MFVFHTLRRPVITFCLFLLVLITWGVNVLHLGVITFEGVPLPEKLSRDLGGAQWIPKEEAGINQLILFGDPLTRGYASGKLTSHLMYQQEATLIEKFYDLFPNPLIRTVLILGLLRWYWGIEDYFEDWMLKESYGVSLSASPEFNFLLDPFSRQIAYHGLHEVGQMMIDRGVEAMGCTVFAIPYEGSWVIGRNFDFEGGKIFDDQKILKWVFPDKGFPFVAVTWAGMVGAVTGVNENGVYISINAAGSTDFARFGTPSTLVLLKALQFSRTADEARKIIEDSKMFITDIFVVADPRSLFRIEKSPRRFYTLSETRPTVITNHLIGEKWISDQTNEFRKRESTTLSRETRGRVLLSNMASSGPHGIEDDVLSMLRDKNDKEGNPLHLGNRQGIDALIAAHSVIYNGVGRILYVSQGPAVSGPFLGYDLRRSFERRMPVLSGHLAQDPVVSIDQYIRVKESMKSVDLAGEKIKSGKCKEALEDLQKAEKLFEEQGDFYRVFGDYYECIHENEKARQLWNQALILKPAYLKDRNYLFEKLSLAR